MNSSDADRTVTPVPAASVILVRPSDNGFEVFMARRHIKSDFAPDVYVFPGGKASADDGEDRRCLLLSNVPKLASGLEPDVGWRAIFMAAIRELFEESGLLLARATNGNDLDVAGDSNPDRFADYRHQIRSGSLTMRDVAQLEGLVYVAQNLLLFSNWITPPSLSKRFDTFFFVARLPAGQNAYHADLHELTHSLWITPSAALDRYREGNLPLVFATERHLERLHSFSSIEDLCTRISLQPVETICPRWFMRDDEPIFVIPGDRGYETARTT